MSRLFFTSCSCVQLKRVNQNLIILSTTPIFKQRLLQRKFLKKQRFEKRRKKWRRHVFDFFFLTKFYLFLSFWMIYQLKGLRDDQKKNCFCVQYSAYVFEIFSNCVSLRQSKVVEPLREAPPYGVQSHYNYQLASVLWPNTLGI